MMRATCNTVSVLILLMLKPLLRTSVKRLKPSKKILGRLKLGHSRWVHAEPNYQAQYDYFKAGNSKVANKHSATGTAAVWWLRSPYYYTSDNGYYFCAVSSSGSLDYHYANSAYGDVPGFVV